MRPTTHEAGGDRLWEYITKHQNQLRDPVFAQSSPTTGEDSIVPALRYLGKTKKLSRAATREQCVLFFLFGAFLSALYTERLLPSLDERSFARKFCARVLPPLPFLLYITNQFLPT